MKLITLLLFGGKNNLPNSSEILGFFFPLFTQWRVCPLGWAHSSQSLPPDSGSVCYLLKEERKKTSAAAETLLYCSILLRCWHALNEPTLRSSALNKHIINCPHPTITILCCEQICLVSDMSDNRREHTGLKCVANPYRACLWQGADTLIWNSLVYDVFSLWKRITWRKESWRHSYRKGEVLFNTAVHVRLKQEHWFRAFSSTYCL